jgi:hypothetical protein
MKLRILCTTALAMAGAVPAFAQVYVAPDPAPIVVDTRPAYPGGIIEVPAVRPGGLIHGGYVAPGDEQLLSDAVAALASDHDMNGANVTMVAKNGELIVNAVARNTAQAARIDRITKRVANGRVTAQYTTQQG